MFAILNGMWLSVVAAIVLVAAVTAVVVDRVRDRPVAVNIAWSSRHPIAEVRAEATSQLVHAVSRSGYRVTSSSDAEIILVRTYRPLFIWAVTILLFPVGLIAYLLNSKQSSLVLTFESAAGGETELRLAGEAQGSVAAKLRRLADSNPGQLASGTKA